MEYDRKAGRLPNLVIIGAPKCGTSTLFAWLAEHPGVCPADTKETFYLVDQDSPFRAGRATIHDKGLDGYRRHFERCQAHVGRVMEATTHYLYATTACHVLSSLDPQPDVVVVLRRPSMRAYSSFRFTRDRLRRVPSSLSFADWVVLLDQGRKEVERHVAPGPSSYVLQRDIAYGQYIDYVGPWLERFPAHRFHVLLFEDLVGRQRATMVNLAKRLQLDPEFYEEYWFPHENQTVIARNARVARLAPVLRGWLGHTRIPGWAQFVYRAAHLNKREQPMTDDEQRAVERLDAYYEPYNESLAVNLGLDLHAWSHHG